jgi:serine protease Do
MRRRNQALIVLALLVTGLPAGAADPFLRRTATVRAVEKVGPAVVSISSSRLEQQSPFVRGGGDSSFDRFFRDFVNPRRPRGTPGDLELGSGVIIDPEGHVLTNEHVIARASRIRVKLADGRSFDASVIGADPNNDLAVLQIDTDEKLPSVPLGQSDDLLVGEPVIAIGNPFGFSNTVTTGVISALDRSFHTPDHSYSFHGFIQTDASINPGNSGGPLLNAAGTLIGINSALYNGAQGIGFALPADSARRVASELIEHGEITPIWLGAEFQDLDPALHEVMDVPQGLQGVLLTHVREDSPAARAGLRRGDVMLRLDGRDLGTARDVVDYLETVLVDQELQLELWRDGKSLALSIRTEELPATYVRDLARRLLGLSLDAKGQDLGFRVSAVDPASSAFQIGLRPGDRLLAVNGRPLEDDDDLRRAMVDLRLRRMVNVVVQRAGGRYHVRIPLV